MKMRKKRKKKRQHSKKECERACQVERDSELEEHETVAKRLEHQHWQLQMRQKGGYRKLKERRDKQGRKDEEKRDKNKVREGCNEA